MTRGRVFYGWWVTIFVVHQCGAALGSWLGGAVFELTRGYGAAFAIDEGARCSPRLRAVVAQR